MDTGRNEPCPCGSGKKYKRCCGAPKTDPMEFAAGRVRATQESAEPKILRYLREELEDEAAEDAWYEFCLGREEPGLEHNEAHLFIPWVLYDWEPWELAADEPELRYARLTPAWMTIARNRVALTPAEYEFLRDTACAPTSFHEVVRCDPGQTVVARDVYLGTEETVFDRDVSTSVQPGDLIYGRVVANEDVSLFVGWGTLVIPPIQKSFLLDARKNIWGRKKLTSERLCKDEAHLRGLYFMIRDAILSPPRPELANTDGDPMEFHTLTYTVSSAEAAVTALAPLASEDSVEALLAELRRARPGGRRRVEFAWTRPGNPMHGGMRNTVMAEFKVNGTTLTIEANSANRAQLVKDEIAKRLGEQATFVRDDRRSMSDVLAAEAARPETQRDRVARKNQEELEARPEIQAMLAKMNADHYATWPDIPLPALKGKTPRAAMKSKDGRERVEALITDFERSQGRGDTTMPRYDFNELRAMLGLPFRKT
jgi:hypothetical protein